MKDISQVYDNLMTFLNEIVITEKWEKDESSTILDGDNKPTNYYRVALYNGIYIYEFLGKLDKILETVSKDLGNVMDNNEPTNKYINECETIINGLIESLETKESNIIKLNPDKDISAFLEERDTIISKIIRRLLKHKESLGIEIKPKPLVAQSNAPLIWNENTNKLVDLFYQLVFELKTRDSEPLLEASTVNLAHFIVNNFIGQDGLPLSFDTVQTILKPGRVDKRPQAHTRIKIKYIP